MFSSVLIANRGAIATRIERTLKKMGLGSVAVYSDADKGSLHVARADKAIALGGIRPTDSYLRTDLILEAAQCAGAGAIHPGYGFLSENADFAEACEQAGIVFIGPTAAQMRAFGLKHKARELAVKHNVPLTPGSGLLSGVTEALAEANRIGYPVMLKSTAGGGGIGMRLCADAAALAEAWESVTRLAQANFKDGGAYVERYVARGRHVEVQVAGDGTGAVIAVGDRDCSAQRRHQKVIEEAPAPNIPDKVRAELHACAVRLCEAVQYRSVGTVEFLYDAEREAFYFLEVNTRLQVEHGVTEEVTGIDLVEWMICLARGESLESVAGPLGAWPKAPNGHALQARVYAENAVADFRPSTGILSQASFPKDTRVETWVEKGTEITPHYDPMLAKVIAHGAGRMAARLRLIAALRATRLEGLVTNVDYLTAVCESPEFAQDAVDTGFLNRFEYAPKAFEILEAGPQTSVQDWPGRIGYWDVGVPPSGPMDAYSFRLGNALVGNPSSAAGLEFTLAGPTLKFHVDSVACLTGGDLPATLDGAAVERWKPFTVRAGQVLKIGACKGAGLRGYLCVRGGIAATPYLGSRATFDLGRFGGPYGRTLQPGDLLFIDLDRVVGPIHELALPDATNPPAHIDPPTMDRHWEIGVLYGPHGAPDFFTEDDIAVLFSATYTVHHNSNRTGVRLTGPKPVFARADGGEAGLHPSNIHDNAYAIGAIDFTGDMPILLGPDGPSLGGFVCPAVTAQAELWKLGQLRPGDTIRFHRWDARRAEQELERQESVLGSGSTARGAPPQYAAIDDPHAAVLHRLPPSENHPGLCLRRVGDAYLLVEYGPLELDLVLRVRVQALLGALKIKAGEKGIAGILEMTPGIRSLQLHFDPRVLRLSEAMEAVIVADAALPAVEEMEFPSRVVHMPLSWDDEAIHRIIERYTTTVRPDAPWCPSNIEFIRRINGLTSIDDVKRTVFDASYLVMGLGDVYLGAPVATPLDPRHRLVTTKYNPARTWTVDNVVGIGGAYMCIYGMEGPGGYQLFGRTSQVWNTHRVTPDFEAGKPWLLRFFDQIRFYPVTHDELTVLREDVLAGRTALRTEETVFNLGEYTRFLAQNDSSIAEFRRAQRDAFAREREQWKIDGTDKIPDAPESGPSEDIVLPEGCEGVGAPLAGNVLRVLVSEGDTVTSGQTVAVLESMKMEFHAVAPSAGTVRAVKCKPGSIAQAGQWLAVIEVEGVS